MYSKLLNCLLKKKNCVAYKIHLSKIVIKIKHGRETSHKVNKIIPLVNTGKYGVSLGSETGFLIPLSLTESAPKLLRFVCDLLHKKIALVRSKTLIFSDQNFIIPRTSRQY